MDVHPAKLKVVADCTVEEAKAAVSVWGSHMHRRSPCMGTVWADDQCLHQYNLADGRQITMHPWQIIVRPEGTGDTMSLQVFATDTIGSVKVKDTAVRRHPDREPMEHFPRGVADGQPHGS